MTDVFHPDWQPRPYWWDAAPPCPADDPLPEQVDAVVVGAGYCGLCAARTLAQAGRSVAVLDAGDPGSGASTRNHGMLSGGLKLSPKTDRLVGPDRATAIRATAYESFGYIKDLVRDEGLDVDYAHTGRFFGAHSRTWYERLKARRDDLERAYGYHAHMVPREEQRTEIATDYYHGGMVVAESGSAHPAKLYRAMLDLARAAGAGVFGNAVVDMIDGDGGGAPGAMTVRTSRGTIRARHVISATNAYVGRFSRALSPYLRRRVIPVVAYLIATEELPADLARSLLPRDRMGADTQRSIFAYRLTPDGRRVIFNARPWHRSEIDERSVTATVHRQMCLLWPQLRGTKVTHTWKGLVGFTFDRLPHVGVKDGVMFATGCQGNGVALMSYLGHQMALKLMFSNDPQCGHDGLPFPTRLGYTGNPWFLPAVGASYKLRDAAERAWSAHTST